MNHIYICPECRSEHAEPAHAGLKLAVVCLDCALGLDWHESRLEAEFYIPAAA